MGLRGNLTSHLRSLHFVVHPCRNKQSFELLLADLVADQLCVLAAILVFLLDGEGDLHRSITYSRGNVRVFGS